MLSSILLLFFYVVIKCFSLPFYQISFGNFASLFEKKSYFPAEMDEYLYVWYRSLSRIEV